ncbi:sister chromatid cohesion protein 1 [Stygiomarasmius scandens]|uniref:Sister chromatid cohesion protein 1 n=1 Tax=Marasmiellus scandens TaxID=2682957 RepID=A0ABR1K517_9AGAR
MFYSEAILSRRGPLGKVWLAAHMERKLSKTQTLQTDIEESVDAIMGQDIEFMALRLSGQLLLGVVRIYSRKAKYLLDDCNEALLKIKMAFRPGAVDMTEEQLVANKNAITIQANAFDLDLLMPDPNWLNDLEERPVQAHGQHQAHIDDITLRPTDTFEPFDYLQDNFDLGPSDGIGSQDFLDLGLDFGDGPVQDEEQNQDSMSVDGSVGVGRDAGAHLDSIDAQFMDQDLGNMDLDILSNKSRSREPSEHPFGAEMNLDVPDFEGIDLGDLGIGFDDNDVNMNGLPAEGEKTPGQTRSPSRASSPLTEPPATPPPPDVDVEATPTVAKVKRKAKEKKQIIDSVTELQDGARGRNAGAPVNRDLSDILTEPQFLPRSSTVMRLLEIHNDPLAHFLPTRITPNGTYLCAAPPGLAPELAALFMRPVGAAHKRRGASPGKSPNKRRRVEEPGNEEDVELGRRAASLAPSVGMGSDVFRRESQGPDGLEFPDQMGGVDDFQLDVPEFENAGVDLERARSKSAALTDRSRMSTPVDGMPDEGDENYADLTCPIAMFDSRPQTQTQTTEKEEPVDTEGKGYSRNTVKALSIIRKELRPTDGEEEKVLSFEKMADKASRRAAASFFFELLVLGTRDCIKISQAAPFENIEIRAKDKLWERGHMAAPSRFGSAAPSRLGSVAPSVASSRAPSVARSIASSMGL